MPRVPTLDEFGVGQSAAPAAAFQPPGAPQPGAFGAEQSQRLGQTLAAAGGHLGEVLSREGVRQDAEIERRFREEQQQANQVRVIDAMNQAKERVFDLTYGKEAGFTLQKGIAALQRPDGKAMDAEYTDKLKETLGGIADGLGNPEQKRAFAMHAGDLATQFRGSVERHMAQEFQTYQGSVYDGAAANAQRDIALAYADPAASDRAVQTLAAAVRQKARLVGMSQEFADVQVRKAVSDAHTLAIGNALERNDVAFADSYLKRNAGQMDPDDILKVRGTITKEMDLRRADGAAHAAVAAVAPKMFATDGDRAFNILIGAESRGRQFGADGKPLQSTIMRNGQRVEGAIGIAQIMRDTGPEAAKLAGLPWDEARYRNDAEYNRALGKAYFSKQVQAFGGDLALAYAAYNAGPGATREALARAKARPGGDWLTFLPAETQAYVRKNMAAYESGGGAPAAPTLQDVHEQVRATLGPNARPQVVQAAIARSTQAFEDLAKARRQRDDEATANALRGVLDNGGKFADLPPSVRGAIPAKDLDNVMAFAGKVAKGDDRTNPAVYQKLADDNVLRGLTDDQLFKLRGELSEADFKHFSALRGKLLNPKATPGTDPGDLDSGAVRSVVDDSLRALNIDPTPKDDGGKDSARVGAVRKFVADSLLDAQRNSGKKFNDAEVRQHVGRLFATSTTFRNTFMGMETGGTTAQQLLTMKPGDIPGATRDALKKDFARAGIAEPTDAQLLGAYWTLKTRRAAP